MAASVRTILEELGKKNAPVLPLLHKYHSDAYAHLWRRDPRLHLTFAKRLTDDGHPVRAFELAQDGLKLHKNDLDLRYRGTLALARGRSFTRAEEFLGPLLRSRKTPMRLRIEAISLSGRLHKDRYALATNNKERTYHALKAATRYARAHALGKKSFPTINAATMYLLGGEARKAHILAQEAIERATVELQAGDDYWILATLGEAHLLLGHAGEALRYYKAAVKLARGKLGDLRSMRDQLRLLKRRIPVSEQIESLFQIGTVLVFSGHMIDHPGRATPRFPASLALEKAVRADIGARLTKQNIADAYCSLACGSDILFAEEALRRKIRLHVVLPFDQEDFMRTSVTYGLPSMAKWGTRFKRVLSRATEVYQSTQEQYLGDDMLFGFVNSVTQGLALMRASELGVSVRALALHEPGSPLVFGGTGYFLDQWKALGNPADEIDLASLRRAIPDVAVTRARRGRGVVGKKKQVRGQRKLMAMLFADVKGFSSLSEEQSRKFFRAFLSEVARILKRAPSRPAFSNTWGDGLFVVFEKSTDCAAFASQLTRIDFGRLGLPPEMAIRVGLHTGPVYPGNDPVIGKENFFGANVNRAARIEPVTAPGCAYASEQFAAMLAVTPGHKFRCEFIGKEELAKNYDQCRLYRLV